jgi:hypothetical protein
MKQQFFCQAQNVAHSEKHDNTRHKVQRLLPLDHVRELVLALLHGLDVALDLRHQRLQRLPRAVARRRRGRTAEHDAGNKTARVEHRIRDDANST